MKKFFLNFLYVTAFFVIQTLLSMVTSKITIPLHWTMLVTLYCFIGIAPGAACNWAIKFIEKSVSNKSKLICFLITLGGIIFYITHYFEYIYYYLVYVASVYVGLYEFCDEKS